jgi:hypothetical protein
MIKQLFFTAALLVPGLAYGANPSADLSVQIVPAGGTACDTGTNAPSIPAAAQAAGFTTCALYLDFTKGGYAANTANYINECGATIPHPISGYFVDDSNGNYLGLAACNRTTIATAPSGSQALLVSDRVTDKNNNHGMFSLSWPSPPGVPGPLGTQNYNEITFQLTGRTQPGSIGNPVIFAWWHRNDTSGPGPNGTNAYIEYDDIEIYRNGYSQMNAGQWNHGGADHSFIYFLNCGTNVSLCPDNVDWTQVHRWGVLTTSDGSTQISVCGYLDGALKQCAQIVPTGTAAEIADQFQKRDMNMNVWIGNCSGGLCLTEDINIYVLKMQMWECANWLTQTCPGTVLTNPPSPT